MVNSERWQALCSLLGATQRVDSTFSELIDHYQATNRAYHNLEHISQCLKEYDLLKTIAANAGAVEFAIWFHDAVYDTRAKDNEEKSAALAEAALHGMGISGQLPYTVGSLIRLTKHDVAPTTIDGQVIVDVDLAILGQSAEVFDRYESGIRSEYSWVSDSEFWPKRTEFLMALLAREHIFYTEQCREKYELTARSNLRRSIQRSAGHV